MAREILEGLVEEAGLIKALVNMYMSIDDEPTYRHEMRACAGESRGTPGCGANATAGQPSVQVSIRFEPPGRPPSCALPAVSSSCAGSAIP